MGLLNALSSLSNNAKMIAASQMANTQPVQGTAIDSLLEQWIDVTIDDMTFPVNPPELQIIRGTRNITYEVLETGEIVLPNTPDLERINFTSLFWRERQDQASITYMDTLNEWRESKEPKRLVIINNNPESDYHGYNKMVLCNNFDTNEGRAGSEDDVYYTLNLIEYREDMGAAEADIADDPITGEPFMLAPEPIRVDERPTPGQTVEVVRGDSLWAITQSFGQPGTAWHELYNIPENKLVIGENPHMIHPGQILIVPEHWADRTRTTAPSPQPRHPTAHEQPRSVAREITSIGDTAIEW